MGELKQIKRDPIKYEIFGALSETLGQSPLHDEVGVQDFLSKAAESVRNLLKNDAFLHGRRVESMFENIVVSLGHIRFLKHEDAGGGWYDADSLEVPDFRIILENGEQFLVEVKNYHANCIERPYTLKSSYVEGLLKYGELMGCPLRLAVYFSYLGIWCLVPIELLVRNGNKHALSLDIALKGNTMSALGDVHIATVPPLEMHWIADQTKPRWIEESYVNMTIGAVEIYCGGILVTAKQEKDIATMLMLFGEWDEREPQIVYDDEGVPIKAIHKYAPVGLSENGFDMVGSLSSMYSRRFAFTTLDKGHVKRVATAVIPGMWEKMIPDDYAGSALPLWRIRMQPSLEVAEKHKNSPSPLSDDRSV